MAKENYLMMLTVAEFETIQMKMQTKLLEHAVKIAQSNLPPASQDPLTIHQVSEMTGYSVSTLYTMCSKRKIKYQKAEGRKFLRFKREDVIDFINGKT